MNRRILQFAIVSLSLVNVALLSPQKAARAQAVIAIGDEWLLSDDAFLNNNTATTALARNIASFLTGGTNSGNFLAYSGNIGLTGTSLATTMTGNGYTWTVSTAQPFTLSTLSQYDAVLLAGGFGSGAANAAVLQSYLNSGGSILILAGTGEFGDASSEAGAWSPFLSSVGLAFGSTWFPVAGLIEVPALPGGHPLRQNVDSVRWGFGQTAFELNAASPFTETALIGQFGGAFGDQPIISTYQVVNSAAPEPGSMFLLAAGASCAGSMRTRRSRKRRVQAAR
jgi:hypothetical protein